METMLTFVSGWTGRDRDHALFNQRDLNRKVLFFLDNSSTFPELMPNAPLIELYRNGIMDFKIGADSETLIRVNYDTDHDLIMRAVTHVLLNGEDAQIVVTFDALDTLYRLFPALRAANAMLAANERLDAQPGDRVLFTRGGSFRWKDNFIEAQTSLLASSEVFDAGIVPDDQDL
jgi:hypothetical protein